MKRTIITLAMAAIAWTGLNAMSYERAREEAIYLTDKMAYELNLNDQQYNDAYEINLDYLMSLETERDLYGSYLEYRLTDFRHILFDWQYDMLLAADYFVRPVIWRTGGWYFPIYTHYRRGLFYFDWPGVYWSYRGGHGHLHFSSGYYVSRRPVWSGGMRGMGADRRGWNAPAPRNGRGSMNRPGEVRRQSPMDGRPQTRGSISGSRGSVVPNQRGGNTPMQRGNVAPESRGSNTPMQRGNVAPESRSGNTPMQRGNVAPESRNRNTPMQRGNVAPETRSNNAPSSRSNIFSGSSTRSTVTSPRSTTPSRSTSPSMSAPSRSTSSPTRSSSPSMSAPSRSSGMSGGRNGGAPSGGGSRGGRGGR